MAKQKADKPRLSEAQIRAMVADGKTFPQIMALLFLAEAVK